MSRNLIVHFIFHFISYVLHIFISCLNSAVDLASEIVYFLFDRRNPDYENQRFAKTSAIGFSSVPF